MKQGGHSILSGPTWFVQKLKGVVGRTHDLTATGRKCLAGTGTKLTQSLWNRGITVGFWNGSRSEVISWIKHLSPKRSEIWIPDLPFTLVADGNSLTLGLFPQLTYWDLMWFYAITSLRVMVAGSPPVLSPSGCRICPFHCSHASDMSQTKNHKICSRFEWDSDAKPSKEFSVIRLTEK